MFYVSIMHAILIIIAFYFEVRKCDVSVILYLGLNVLGLFVILLSIGELSTILILEMTLEF